jgi:hypothetical protein
MSYFIPIEFKKYGIEIKNVINFYLQIIYNLQQSGRLMLTQAN